MRGLTRRAAFPLSVLLRTPQATVHSARGIASEGGPLPYSASIALLGLDPVESEPVESEPVEEAYEPAFNLSTSSSFHADDTSCKLLLTTPLAVAVYKGALPACYLVPERRERRQSPA